jgi:Aspartate/tyrosine/aromatic aminotransferase
VREFCEAHPEGAKRLIRCGIGDVTEPLPPAAIEAMKRAVDELGHRESFRGYGPEQGYEFLRSTIAQRDYRDRNIRLLTTKFSFLTDQKTIAVTSSIFSAAKTRSRSPIQSIRCTWTQT